MTGPTTTTTTATITTWDRRADELGPTPAAIEARAAKIKVLAFDVDGVCTDGRLYYGPQGCALHAFSARDGLGLVRARLAGLTTCAISGRASDNVTARLSELRVPYIRQGVVDKARELTSILDEVGATMEEVCYVGDDVNDLALLRLVGLSAAVADGEPCLFRDVHLITRRGGGQGVLRELAELILRARGQWSDT